MHLVSSANKRGAADCTESGRSLIKMINKRGPRMLPCGTPEVTFGGDGAIDTNRLRSVG